MTAYAQVPLALLAIAGLIGAFDVNYYHLWKFRLHARAESRAETMTHLARGALVAVLAVVIANYEPRGAWFWFVVALVGLDVVNNVIDVLLEPKARAEFGGVPPFEYLIHVIGATLAGAAGASFITLGWSLGAQPTALAPTMLPTAWSVLGNALAIGALVTTGSEAFLTLRATRKAKMEAS